MSTTDAADSTPEGWLVDRLDRWANVISTRMSYTDLESIGPSASPRAHRVLGIKVSDMNLPGNETVITQAALTRELPNEVAERRCAPPGTVVFPKRGAAIATNKKRLTASWTVFDPNVIGVVAGNEVEDRFLFYWFQNFDLRTITEPGPTPQLNKKNLEPLLVRVPRDRGEQRAISRILDTVQVAIDMERRCERNVQELRRFVVQRLFSSGIHGEAQKDTEIGRLPASWEVVRFESVREWLQYGTSTRCTEDIASYPVLRIPNIESGRVNTDDLKYADFSAAEVESYLLETGDLLFIRTNGVVERLGACAVYEGSPARALFASYLIRARLKRARIDPRFAAFFFGSEVGVRLIGGRATPAADGKYNLNTGTIESLPLPLPPTLDEQREIVSIIESIDRKSDVHRRKRDVLERLFAALLRRLVSGELRISSLDLSLLQSDVALEQTQ